MSIILKHAKIYKEGGGGRLARPTLCLVTIADDDRGLAICIKLTAKAPNVHNQ